MSADKIRFTEEQQRKCRNRMDGIKRRAHRLCDRAVWRPEPWTKAQHNRARLLCDLISSWTARRMGWERTQ